jgi:hypothetical protein
MGAPFEVSGRIGDRWRATGAERGPLGRPVAAQQDLGGESCRQTFEGGEIAWSAGQKAVVTAYRLWKDVVFEWTIVEQYTYDYFRFDVTVNGTGHGHSQLRVDESPTRGRRWIRLQGHGEYAFTVKGVDNPTVGHERSRQGPTVPVRVVVGPGPAGPFPTDPPVTGLIAERWDELGGWDGALGRPVAPEEVGGGDYHVQLFARGTVARYPGLGPAMTVLAYQQGRSVVIDWGYIAGAISVQSTVDVFLPETGQTEPVFTQQVSSAGLEPLDWAMEGGSSGHVRFDPARSGQYGVRVTDFVGRSFGVWIDVTLDDVHLDPLARGGTPERAYATMSRRVDALVAHAVRSRPLVPGPALPGEDLSIALLARCHSLSRDSQFRGPNELPAYVLVNEVLKEISAKPVGTSANEFVGPFVCSTEGEYDTFLKGLIAIVYRYPDQLAPEVYQHVVSDLLTLSGGHSLDIETKEICCDFGPTFGFLIHCIDPPESENHLLLIESSRYLINQLLFRETPDTKHDNKNNGLADWLLGYLQRIARFDFHEYNARPYQRYSLNALLNLNEFAEDPRIRTAAAILLDYTTVKVRGVEQPVAPGRSVPAVEGRRQPTQAHPQRFLPERR